jgi:dihydropteroate synthase
MRAQGTNFASDFSLTANGKTISLKTPVVMGILNLTPDSFYDGGSLVTEKELLTKTEKHIADGAAIIDIGAVSTKPNAVEVTEEEELQRLLPALKVLRKNFPHVFISIDTYRSQVAQAAAGEGADIINDISGGTFDNNMFDAIAKLNLPYILMHIQGTPQTMQQNPQYNDVVTDVFTFLSTQTTHAKQKGIAQLMIDVGFGFGKTTPHNYTLLANLIRFADMGLPILVGASRKGMIYKTLHNTPQQALNGTTVINTLALLNGANILRVHDAKEASEAIALVNQYRLG